MCERPTECSRDHVSPLDLLVPSTPRPCHEICVCFLSFSLMAHVEPTAHHCLIQGEENTSKVVCIRKHEVINSAENSMIGPKSEPDQFLYVATQREGEERQNELVCGR